MIELYYWPTPNGHKITIFLEEAEIEYQITTVNIAKGDQFQPDFRKISPNNRIPAIIDYQPPDGGEPITVFESGAILLYLAQKTGKFFPSSPREQIEVMEWLFWQVGGLGPMAGQNHHFGQYAPVPIPYAIDRSICQLNYSTLRRAQSPIGGSRIHYWQLFHCGYGLLSLGCTPPTPTTKPGTIPSFTTVV